jgi:5-methylcytosine-specific restriction enzyme subunit McrC
MNTLTCFEHTTVRVGQGHFSAPHFRALARLNERYGNAWFTLLDQGVRFHSYVGVIQLPGLLLEILPKTDKVGPPNATRWRQVLLQMLRVSGQLPMAAPTIAALAQRPLALLEVYIRLFVEQAETLLRQGLVKQYRVTEGNKRALKGRLLFSQQLTHNLVHQERFYTQHQVYDQENELNSLLAMGLRVASQVTRVASLAARIHALLLHWPEVKEVPIPLIRPQLMRKTERYGPALDLALLLLRHLSPDLSKGEKEAAALLFDMNRLFEVYVARQLRVAAADSGAEVHIQNREIFWNDTSIRPDLVVQFHNPTRRIILDTKWKLPGQGSPSAADLQQVYAYCHIWKAAHGLLLYPNPDNSSLNSCADYSSSGWAPTAPIRAHLHFLEVITSKGSLNKMLGKSLLEHLRSL